MKSYRSGLLELLLKKTVSKFWEFPKKNIHCEEQLKQSCTYSVTEVTPCNG